MGKTIAGLIAEDGEITIAAGIDAFDDGKNPFPVLQNIDECDVKADVIIDFSVAAAMDGLLNYCMEKEIPCVLCTTGLSEAQLDMVKKVRKDCGFKIGEHVSGHQYADEAFEGGGCGSCAGRF